MTELARLHATVTGRVQGVGFRQATQRQAFSLGLVGWVANRIDGSVEVVAEGPRPQLQKLAGWLHDGPPGARVREVHVAWQEPASNLSDFRVRF
ncbi:MAG: acylphosphatase [Anaerolineae bacterium]